MSGKLFASIASLLCCATICFAQPTTQPMMQAPSDTPEQKAVRTALVDFLTLLEKPDVAEAKKAFAGTDQEWALIENMHGTFAAVEKVKASAQKRFPAESERMRQSDDMTLAGLKRQATQPPVTITGDTATVGYGKRGMSLKQDGGAWKVTALATDPEETEMMTILLPLFTEVATQASADLDAGKFATYPEFEKAMQNQMQTKIMPIMMQKAMQKAATRPTTQPAP